MRTKFDLSKSHQHSTKVFKILWHLHKRLKKKKLLVFSIRHQVYVLCLHNHSAFFKNSISIEWEIKQTSIELKSQKNWVFCSLSPILFYFFLVERCKYLHPHIRFWKEIMQNTFYKKHHLFRENFILFFSKFTFNNFF